MSMTRSEALLEQIVHDHEMQDTDQVWQWEATGIRGREYCTVCGLTHDWYVNGQNNSDKDVWMDFYGNPISLAEAARQPCGQQ
jgi:hypothetical protein